MLDIQKLIIIELLLTPIVVYGIVRYLIEKED